MRFHNSLAFGMAACLMAATPVFAQSTPDNAKPKAKTETMAKEGSQKQHTAGAPAGGDFQPQQYGAATKQHTAGAPAGGDFRPQRYGSDQGTVQK